MESNAVTHQECPLLPLFNIVLGVLVWEMRQNKYEINDIQIGKEEIKLSVFIDDIILYMENSKDIVEKLWELIDEFNKIAKYKIVIQNLIAFLYTSNEQSKNEIKETIAFTITSKNTYE